MWEYHFNLRTLRQVQYYRQVKKKINSKLLNPLSRRESEAGDTQQFKFSKRQQFIRKFWISHLNTRPKKMTKPQKSFSTVFFLDFTVNFCFLHGNFHFLFFHINIIQVIIFHQPGTPLLSKNNHSLNQLLLLRWGLIKPQYIWLLDERFKMIRW